MTLNKDLVVNLGRRLESILTPGNLGFILIVANAYDPSVPGRAAYSSNINRQDAIKVLERILKKQKEKQDTPCASETSANPASKPKTS